VEFFGLLKKKKDRIKRKGEGASVEKRIHQKDSMKKKNTFNKMDRRKKPF